MKKRIFISMIIFLILQIVYIFAYIFYLKDFASKYIDKDWILNLVLYVPIFVFGLIIAFLFGAILFSNHSLKENKRIQSELSIEQELNKSLIDNNKNISSELPIGLIIYNKHFNVVFVNDFAKKIFETAPLGKEIKSLSKELYSSIIKRNKTTDIQIYEKTYRCTINTENRIVYMFDITEQTTALDTFEKIKPSIAILSMDNLDESLAGYDLKEKTEILGKYYNAIKEWSKKFDLFVLSDSSNKQAFVVKAIDLKKMIEDDFSILKETDRISKSENMGISLSIGIGTGSIDYRTLGFFAEKALEFASERGGNQAVIYNGETRSAYGGNTPSYERISRISTKLYANKLINYIQNSSSVVIMPHGNTDADALGSAMGIYEICESINTPAKILLDKDNVDSTVKKIIETSSTEYIKLHNIIIGDDDLDKFFVGKRLLIVTDHHSKRLSPSQKVYDFKATTTIIDHHRLNERLDIESDSQFIDHGASSAVEIVTEIASLVPKPVEFSPFTATAMFVGMMIDTQKFAVHVSERTFQSASVLMDCGADAFKAKMIARESVQEQTERMKNIEKATTIEQNFSIFAYPTDDIQLREGLAKTANALIEVDGIDAGFAIGKIDKDIVGISARSNGLVNIHVLMEHFGGGGHFNMGAAQIKDKSIEEVRAELINVIKELKDKDKRDDNSMKVILVKDVKGRGKKGDVIDVTPGFANFLLTKKDAIEANAANMAVLNEEKASEEKRKKEELELATKLKEVLSKLTVVVKVKTGEKGKFFGSVSNKMISEELLKQHNIEIDKRKIVLPKDKIDSLGTFKCTVKLHANVESDLTIDIKEDKEE